MRTTV
jgi:hypothetical protein